ncbi:hypothetical protein ABW19_dt0206034 [Dactylella cylindrospora]|nr:hypothetical protein ABW19_dt0206034 [Dactylella cylindrospora]
MLKTTSLTISLSFLFFFSASLSKQVYYYDPHAPLEVIANDLIINLPGQEYHRTLEGVIDEMHGPSKLLFFNAPHMKCRRVYCDGANLGVSLCSQRNGNSSEPAPIDEVRVYGEVIGSILKEWVGAYRTGYDLVQTTLRIDPTVFTAPIYGLSLWDEDPSWSINVEQCGSVKMGFGEDAVYDQYKDGVRNRTQLNPKGVTWRA